MVGSLRKAVKTGAHPAGIRGLRELLVNCGHLADFPRNAVGRDGAISAVATDGSIMSQGFFRCCSDVH